MIGLARIILIVGAAGCFSIGVGIIFNKIVAKRSLLSDKAEKARSLGNSFIIIGVFVIAISLILTALLL